MIYVEKNQIKVSWIINLLIKLFKKAKISNFCLKVKSLLDKIHYIREHLNILNTMQGKNKRMESIYMCMHLYENSYFIVNNKNFTLVIKQNFTKTKVNNKKQLESQKLFYKHKIVNYGNPLKELSHVKKKIYDIWSIKLQSKFLIQSCNKTGHIC
jgi:hypothetical protein